VLNRVHEAVPHAVLIGGWATWVRTGGPMSHDIDLIVTRPQLAFIRTMTEEMSESRHLAGRKWRATLDGIHLDLYVPHDSLLGQHLQLRTERLMGHQETVDGWVVLDPPGHVATKLAALLDRPDTIPGEKDRQEIAALLARGVDGSEAVRVLHDASTRAPREVTQLIDQAFVYLGDLQLNRDQRRHLNEIANQWRAHSIGHEPLGPSIADPDPSPRDRRRRGPSLGL
jgi:hypothetical protein